MDTNQHTPGAAPLSPGARQALGKAGRMAAACCMLSAAALLALVALTVSGGHVSTYMWIRAGLLLAVAELADRAVISAARGNRRSFERLATYTIVLPVTIVGMDLIPGVCPLWYAAMQAVCVLPLVRVAVIARGSALRAAFPKTG